MKIPLSPNLRGVQRNIDDTAQQPGGLRDAMNLLLDVIGRLDGMYIGQRAVVFNGVFNRAYQWGAKTLGLQSNPESNIQISDNITYIDGPTGNGRAVGYNDHVPLAIEGGQAQILTDKDAPNPFATNTAYIAIDAGNGWGQISGSSVVGPSTTVTFSTILPQVPAGETPQYIVFDRDGDIGSTSAEIRPITAFVDAGGLTSVTYTGADIPADAQYGFIQFGVDAQDTFKPDGFVTYGSRLAAHIDNKIYFSGFIGQAAPFVESQELNDFFWYELNSIDVGHSSQGKIIKCIELRDTIIVFLERAIYTVYGDAPINGAFDNQLVVQEISNDLGVTSYDAANLTTDGLAIFFIGSDQNLYVYGTTITRIDEPIREHPRFRNLTHANCTDKYAIFTGTAVEPDKVPTEIYPKDGGMLYQTTPAFAFHIKRQEFTIFDAFVTDSGNNFIPLNDPERMGVFSSFELNGRSEISISTPDGIKIVNDPTVRSPSLQEFFMCGLATHQIPIDGNLFRTDQVNVIVEKTELARLSVVSPAENPAGNAPLSIARDEPQSSYGITSRYGIFFDTPELHNYVSVAVGYWGELLLDGISDWYNFSIDTPTTTGAYLNQYTKGGFIDRIDVLMSGISDSDETSVVIYADDNGTPDLSSIIFKNSIRKPSTGFVNSANQYWRTCDIRINVDGPFWAGVVSDSGTPSIYRVASNKTMYLDSSIAFANQEIMLRVIQEAGNPFAARSILDVNVEGELESNQW
ncbi:hypothetical protein [uncultured Paraglaciecola sp.]|uniref:hypothetical protein n=1 Tax=uncultured Paraglaciecola sp. TaxID=1765024 RepID=UPI002620CBCE|nr:hypothetical protein [uncultured Paraglaciecola sp.]